MTTTSIRSRLSFCQPSCGFIILKFRRSIVSCYFKKAGSCKCSHKAASAQIDPVRSETPLSGSLEEILLAGKLFSTPCF